MDLDPPHLEAGELDGAHDASALSGALRRLAMVRELAEIGMTLARDLAARAAAAPEDTRREPGPAFAQLSRAIRLTLAMEATLEAESLAIRNGEPPAPAPRAARPRTPADRPAAAANLAAPWWSTRPSKDSPCPRRNRIRDAVWTAIDAEYDTLTDGCYALDRLHERLIDGEVYDHLLSRPWREAVEAICADLGLDPDWSSWSDDTGFPPTGKYRFASGWSYWPKQAAWHRKQYIQRHGSEPFPEPPPDDPPALE